MRVINHSWSLLLWIFFSALSLEAALAADPKPIKVGFTVVLTGPWASWGENIKNGMLLATHKTVNKFELDFQDDRCEPMNALTNTQRFLTVDQTKLIFAGCVEVLSAIGPVAAKQNALVFGLGGMDFDILSKNKNVISLYSLTDTESRYIVPYWAQLGTVHKVAIIEGASVFADRLGDTMEQLMAKHKIALTSREKIPVETSDFHAIVLRVLRGKPDTILIHLGERSLGLGIRKLRELGFKGEIYSHYVFEAEPVKETGGSALEGVKYSYPVNSHDESADYEKFIVNYKAAYGSSPTANAFLGYDSLMLLDEVVNKCGSTASECIAEAIANMGKREGIAGEVLLKSDRSALRPHGIKEFRNGEFVWLTKNVDPDY